jgi:tetratricopeptide (TPR) repeat protein
MNSSVLSTRLSRQGREYLLQTSWLESKQRIVTTLFSEGKFISQQTLQCATGVSEQELSSLLKSVHHRSSQETSRLFELSEHPNGQHDEAAVRFLLGEAFYQAGLLEEATAELKVTLKLQPKNPTAIKLLAQIYLDRKDYHQAKIHLQSALESYPQYADLRLLSAEVLSAQEKYSAALAELEQALQINPYYAEAHFESASVLIQNLLGRKEFELTADLPGRALHFLEQALRLNPAYSDPRLQLSLELLRKKDYGPALQSLLDLKEKTKGRYRNHLHEYYLKYISQNGALDEKSLAQQIKSLQQLVGQNPAYADLHFQLGTIYMLLCRYITQKAITEYQKALQLNPHYKKAERNMKLCENDLKGIDLLLKAML